MNQLKKKTVRSNQRAAVFYILTLFAMASSIVRAMIGPSGWVPTAKGCGARLG